MFFWIIYFPKIAKISPNPAQVIVHLHVSHLDHVLDVVLLTLRGNPPENGGLGIRARFLKNTLTRVARFFSCIQYTKSL
jgi:hypothetical protein